MDKTDQANRFWEGYSNSAFGNSYHPSDLIGANAQKNPVTMFHYREAQEGDRARLIEILGNSCHPAAGDATIRSVGSHRLETRES